MVQYGSVFVCDGRLGAVQDRCRDDPESVQVIYADTDINLSNEQLRGKRARDGTRRVTEAAMKLSDVGLLQINTDADAAEALAWPHTQLLREGKTLFVSDRDVRPTEGKAFFGLIIGKTPTAACVRGRFWNCRHGRFMKAFLMGKPCDCLRPTGGHAPTVFVPYDKNVLIGEMPFLDSALASHGWACTDLVQHPHPFKTEPSSSSVAAGWKRIESDFLGQAPGLGPKVLFFVYKNVLERVVRDVIGRSDIVVRYGLNDHWPEEVKKLFGEKECFVFPMPGTGWTGRTPVPFNKTFCDVKHEIDKLAELHSVFTKNLT